MIRSRLGRAGCGPTVAEEPCVGAGRFALGVRPTGNAARPVPEGAEEAAAEETLTPAPGDAAVSKPFRLAGAVLLVGAAALCGYGFLSVPVAGANARSVRVLYGISGVVYLGVAALLAWPRKRGN